MDSTSETWNSHRIRPSRNVLVPHGRPNIMYHLPQLYGKADCVCPTEADDLEPCKTLCTFRTSYICDKDVADLCIILMVQSNLNEPKDGYEALNLYIKLKELVLRMF